MNQGISKHQTKTSSGILQSHLNQKKKESQKNIIKKELLQFRTSKSK